MKVSGFFLNMTMCFGVKPNRCLVPELSTNVINLLPQDKTHKARTFVCQQGRSREELLDWKSSFSIPIRLRVCIYKCMRTWVGPSQAQRTWLLHWPSSWPQIIAVSSPLDSWGAKRFLGLKHRGRHETNLDTFKILNFNQCDCQYMVSSVCSVT